MPRKGPSFKSVPVQGEARNAHVTVLGVRGGSQEPSTVARSFIAFRLLLVQSWKPVFIPSLSHLLSLAFPRFRLSRPRCALGFLRVLGLPSTCFFLLCMGRLLVPCLRPPRLPLFRLLWYGRLLLLPQARSLMKGPSPPRPPASLCLLLHLSAPALSRRLRSGVREAVPQ